MHQVPIHLDYEPLFTDFELCPMIAHPVRCILSHIELCSSPFFMKIQLFTLLFLLLVFFFFCCPLFPLALFLCISLSLPPLSLSVALSIVLSFSDTFFL